MDIVYHKAGKEDLAALVSTRIQMLKAANAAYANADFQGVEDSCRAYYIKGFEEDVHVAYLAYDGDVFAGCGGISFYQVMPNYKNPSGMKAYIMNIYTVPALRGRGIASAIVDLLVKEAHGRGIRDITLKATRMGRPVYEKYGFMTDEEAMILPM